MENNTTSAFFRFLKLSDKDQNKAWAVILILALGVLVKIVLVKLEDSYLRQLQDKDAIIIDLKTENKEYKQEVKMLYKENERLYSKPTQKIDSVTTRIDKLIDKIEKK